MKEERSMQVFMEPTDVAREVGSSAATVKMHAAQGDLRVAAMTRRGGRLFLPDDVARYRQARIAQARTQVKRRSRRVGSYE